MSDIPSPPPGWLLNFNMGGRPAYMNPLPVAAILERLATAKATEHHRFWPDNVSLTDTEVFKRTELLRPKRKPPWVFGELELVTRLWLLRHSASYSL
jgi:hypothetical protein